jgi:chromosome segregation ATPase
MVEHAVAKHSYKGGTRQDAELIFKKRQNIIVLKQDTDWWFGYVEDQPNHRGWFPASYVRLEKSADIKHRGTSASGRSASRTQDRSSGVKENNSSSRSRSGRRGPSSSAQAVSRSKPRASPTSAAARAVPAASAGSVDTQPADNSHAQQLLQDYLDGDQEHHQRVEDNHSTDDEFETGGRAIGSLNRQESHLDLTAAQRLTESDGSDVAAMKKEMVRLMTAIDNERRKRQAVQLTLADVQHERDDAIAQLGTHKESIEEFHATHKQRTDDDAKRELILQDLIANSEMLPEMMLASTRLEMEIDSLEYANSELENNINERESEIADLKSEVVQLKRDQADAVIQQQIAATNDTVAKQVQEQLHAERAEYKETIMALNEENARIVKELKSNEKESKKQIKLLNAVVAHEKNKTEDLDKRYQQLVTERSDINNELVMLKAALPQVKEESVQRLGELKRQATQSELQHEHDMEKFREEAEDERDAVIAIHAQERAILEEKNDQMETEIERLMALLKQKDGELATAAHDYEAHKAVARSRDSASAKYKLEVLKRVRTTEAERDNLAKKVHALHARIQTLLSQSAKTKGKYESQHRKMMSQLERERKELTGQISQHQKTTSMLEHDIKRAEEEVVRLRLRADHETEKRRQLEALERARREAERDRDHRRVKNQMRRDEEMKSMPKTAGDLIKDYKKTQGKMAVQIYSTNKPDIYIFGTRKIHLVVLNGRLMVRVGGGYTTIDDFVAKTAPSEARKMHSAMQRARLREEAESARRAKLKRMNRSGSSARLLRGTRDSVESGPRWTSTQPNSSRAHRRSSQDENDDSAE